MGYRVTCLWNDGKTTAVEMVHQGPAEDFARRMREVGAVESVTVDPYDEESALAFAASKFTWGSTGFCRFVVDSGQYGPTTLAEVRAIAAATSTPAEFQTLWDEGGLWEDVDGDEPDDERVREAMGLPPLHHDDTPSLDDNAPLEHFTERG